MRNTKNWIRTIKASKDEIIRKALIEDWNYDKEQAEEIIKSHDYIYLEGSDERDLGYNFVHEVLGSVDEVVNKERFFDYEKFAKLFIESGEFYQNDDGEFIDAINTDDEINTGVKTKEELGKWIYSNFYEDDMNNISEKDKANCFDYKKFGKYLLDECNFIAIKGGFLQV